MTVVGKDLKKLDNMYIEETKTMAKSSHDIQIDEINREITRRENEKKNGFVRGEGKGKYEGFSEMGFEFETHVVRDPVFACAELATVEMSRLKKMISFHESDEAIHPRAIAYIISKGELNSALLGKHLNIQKDAVEDLYEPLIDKGVITMKPDSSFEVVADKESDQYKEAIELLGNSSIAVMKKDMTALFEARNMSQSNDTERETKCKTILSLLNKNSDKRLCMKSKAVTELIKFPILVTKMPHSNYGIIFAGRTDEEKALDEKIKSLEEAGEPVDEKLIEMSKHSRYGGIKLSHFMYVAYEEKTDKKTNEKYRGMVSNPYSDINWNIHQARLKMIGWGIDGTRFREARRYGIFSESNLVKILPQIHQQIKWNWKAPTLRIEPMELYYFQKSECDYEEDGIRYVHVPNASHSIVYEGDVRRGLAGGKSVPLRNPRQGKSGDNKVTEHEIILTDWIPDDPNQPHNVWQERAARHVVSLCKK